MNVRNCLSAALLSALFVAPGCISFRVTADEDDPSIKYNGIGTAYAGFSGIDDWDGNLLKIGVFSGTARKGEWFSLDIWPLGGVGVGLAGARVRVLPFEIGAGALFYKPTLPSREKDEPVDLPEPKDAETGDKKSEARPDEGEHQDKDSDKPANKEAEKKPKTASKRSDN